MCLAETTTAVQPHTHGHGAARVGRRALFAGGAGAALAAALPAPAGAATTAGYGGRTVDLTHPLTDSFPVYTGDQPVRETIATIPANGFYAQRWTLIEHVGTHIDVPGHFTPGGRLLPQLTPAELVRPAVVIDISRNVVAPSSAGRRPAASGPARGLPAPWTPGNPDAQVTVEDIDRFERRHGRIPTGAVVFMYSGWERKIPLGQAAYRGQDANGGYHFPGFGADAVQWLLEHRGIAGVGVDTLSLDNGASTGFEVHHLLLGADRYGLENVANLASIPPRGATVYVGALPLQDGSGGPCRLIATW